VALVKKFVYTLLNTIPFLLNNFDESETAQLTRVLIFVGNESHAHAILWTPPGFFLEFDLADCKEILRDRNGII